MGTPGASPAELRIKDQWPRPVQLADLTDAPVPRTCDTRMRTWWLGRSETPGKDRRPAADAWGGHLTRPSVSQRTAGTFEMVSVQGEEAQAGGGQSSGRELPVRRPHGKLGYLNK